MTTTLNRIVDVGTRRGAALPTPLQIREVLPITPSAELTVAHARETFRAILHARESRLIVVVGPCSVHDAGAAREFGEWLHGLQSELADQLFLIMRAYVEKPRTRFGWNGLVRDPNLDGTGHVADGIQVARKLFLDLHAHGVPAATEFVDVMTAPFLDDLVSWVAIGARTAESPIHRQLASGLPCPVGFKNGTDGSLNVAMDGVAVSRAGHTLVSIDEDGRASCMQTPGNPASHVILRGGKRPNHDPETIRTVLANLTRIGAPARLLIDCSHGNADQPGGQTAALESVARQIRDGTSGIMGVMLESNLIAGCQTLDGRDNLVYGQSITDPCLDLDDTAALLHDLAAQQRRRQ